MNKPLQPIRGTKDLFGKDYKVQEYIINVAKTIGELYGYEPISTPIIEYSYIFERSLGETSDVISKEIYSFQDKSNETIALRPEFTAGIARAFISNGLTHSLPLKLFSFGPVFRYDRPQAGRQRQFNQFNFEFLGADGPHHDAEVIKLAQDILNKLDLEVTLEVNSLGCFESKKLYNKKLFEYFSDYKNQLSEDSLKRLDKNPLRILDSKNENDKKLVLISPLMQECYSENAKKYFDELLKFLDLLNVKYNVNPRLVRGLDYYQHTCFEYITTKIGAQSTVLGGGRYDGLIELMGGPKTPAIGFGAGIERLAMIKEYDLPQTMPVVIIPLLEEDLISAINLADSIRNQDISVIIMDKGKVDKRLTKALKTNHEFVIFIGEEERKSNKYKLKKLSNRSENLLDLTKLINFLKSV